MPKISTKFDVEDVVFTVDLDGDTTKRIIKNIRISKEGKVEYAFQGCDRGLGIIYPYFSNDDVYFDEDGVYASKKEAHSSVNRKKRDLIAKRDELREKLEEIEEELDDLDD